MAILFSMRTLFPLGIVLLVVLAIPGLVVFTADLLGYGAEINGELESRFGVSHRLALAIPAALAMFAVPPILILLYFLRLKRKPIAVPSTFLWKKSIEDLHVNRLMQWIRRNVLLLIQLFAVLAMIYAVLGPRLHGALAGGNYYILMIDNSASMTATDVPDGRLAWAKAQAIKEIDAATDADTGMVIAFSDTAEIRQSYTGDRGALRAAVQAIQPTQRVTRIDEALSLAASLANPSRSTLNEAVAPANPEPGKERTYVTPEGLQATIYLYSDGRFPPVPDFALANLNLVPRFPPIAKPADPAKPTSDNVAIIRFDAERDSDDPTKVTARAIVRNFRGTDADVRVRVEVLAGGTKLIASYDDDESVKDKKRKPIPARTEKPDYIFTIPDLPENADTVLHLKIEGAKDALPLDDEAWAVLGVIRKAKILIVGPENKLLRFFFDGADTKKLAETSYLPAAVLTGEPKDYLQPAREGKYDLVIFDRCAPGTEAMPNANTLFIGSVPPPYTMGTVEGPTVAVPVKGPSVRGWQSRHPIMRNLQALDEVDVAEAVKITEFPARTARLIEGTGNLVLLAALPRNAYTDLVLTFPLLTTDGKWNTNWPLKVSFPLFLRNVALVLGNVRDAGTEDAIKPGQVKVLRLGATPELKLTQPDGTVQTFARGSRPDFLISATDQLGVHFGRWTDPSGGAEQSRRFAVNLFDARESDLSVEESVKVGNQTFQGEEARKTPRDLWKYPVLLGLLALVLEWWVYNRRVQL